jgi:hypothetical protein
MTAIEPSKTRTEPSKTNCFSSRTEKQRDGWFKPSRNRPVILISDETEPSQVRTVAFRGVLQGTPPKGGADGRLSFWKHSDVNYA